jgi:predicted nucleotidyltransferase
VSQDAATDRKNALCAALANACAELPEVRLAYVFGSQLRGNARADSDLDLAIDTGYSTTPRERGAIKLQLIAVLTDRLGALGERADIVELREASPAVAFRVLQEGRIVKETSRAERVRLAAQLMRAYDDDAPRRALFLRAAIRVASRMAEGAQHGRR